MKVADAQKLKPLLLEGSERKMQEAPTYYAVVYVWMNYDDLMINCVFLLFTRQ